MEKIHIMADSPCDLQYEDAQKYGIEILPIDITYENITRKEYTEIDIREFWKKLSELDEIPLTAQFRPVEYLERFKAAKQSGATHVICVTISSTASGTYTSGCIARNLFYNEYGEDMRIEMVDSRAYSVMYGVIVRQAAIMRNHGMTFSDIIAAMDEMISRKEAVLIIYSLKYLRKSGRINGGAAFIGEALGMRPVLRCCDGQINIISKVRGDKQLIPAMLQSVRENIEEPENQVIQILYADVPEEDLINIGEAVRREFSPVGVEFFPMGCCIAINTGPNALAVIYSGKKRE